MHCNTMHVTLSNNSLIMNLQVTSLLEPRPRARSNGPFYWYELFTWLNLAYKLG